MNLVAKWVAVRDIIDRVGALGQAEILTAELETAAFLLDPDEAGQKLKRR